MYVPEQVVTNQDLLKYMDTSDAWIQERTGIQVAHAGADVDEVDAIILATSTPDQAFPSTAVRVQAELGVKKGFGFDLAAACAGFIYGLSVADGMIRAGQARGVLVIGSEVYSRILLEGPRHLRAVRGRRRRGRARGGG